MRQRRLEGAGAKLGVDGVQPDPQALHGVGEASQQGVVKGHSSDSIARNLEISLGTVKIHRKNAYHKLRISSQAELFSRFIAALRETLL